MSTIHTDARNAVAALKQALLKIETSVEQVDGEADLNAEKISDLLLGILGQHADPSKNFNLVLDDDLANSWKELKDLAGEGAIGSKLGLEIKAQLDRVLLYVEDTVAKNVSILSGEGGSVFVGGTDTGYQYGWVPESTSMVKGTDQAEATADGFPVSSTFKSMYWFHKESSPGTWTWGMSVTDDPQWSGTTYGVGSGLFDFTGGAGEVFQFVLPVFNESDSRWQIMGVAIEGHTLKTRIHQRNASTGSVETSAKSFDLNLSSISPVAGLLPASTGYRAWGQTTFKEYGILLRTPNGDFVFLEPDKTSIADATKQRFGNGSYNSGTSVIYGDDLWLPSGLSENHDALQLFSYNGIIHVLDSSTGDVGPLFRKYHRVDTAEICLFGNLLSALDSGNGDVLNQRCCQVQSYLDSNSVRQQNLYIWTPVSYGQTVGIIPSLSLRKSGEVSGAPSISLLAEQGAVLEVEGDSGKLYPVAGYPLKSNNLLLGGSTVGILPGNTYSVQRKPDQDSRIVVVDPANGTMALRGDNPFDTYKADAEFTSGNWHGWEYHDVNFTEVTRSDAVLEESKHFHSPSFATMIDNRIISINSQYRHDGSPGIGRTTNYQPDLKQMYGGISLSGLPFEVSLVAGYDSTLLSFVLVGSDAATHQKTYDVYHSGNGGSTNTLIQSAMVVKGAITGSVTIDNQVWLVVTGNNKVRLVRLSYNTINIPPTFVPNASLSDVDLGDQITLDGPYESSFEELWSPTNGNGLDEYGRWRHACAVADGKIWLTVHPYRNFDHTAWHGLEHPVIYGFTMDGKFTGDVFDARRLFRTSAADTGNGNKIVGLATASDNELMIMMNDSTSGTYGMRVYQVDMRSNKRCFLEMEGAERSLVSGDVIYSPITGTEATVSSVREGGVILAPGTIHYPNISSEADFSRLANEPWIRKQTPDGLPALHRNNLNLYMNPTYSTEGEEWEELMVEGRRDCAYVVLFPMDGDGVRAEVEIYRDPRWASPLGVGQDSHDQSGNTQGFEGIVSAGLDVKFTSYRALGETTQDAEKNVTVERLKQPFTMVDGYDVAPTRAGFTEAYNQCGYLFGIDPTFNGVVVLLRGGGTKYVYKTKGISGKPVVKHTHQEWRYTDKSHRRSYNRKFLTDSKYQQAYYQSMFLDNAAPYPEAHPKDAGHGFPGLMSSRDKATLMALGRNIREGFELVESFAPLSSSSSSIIVMPDSLTKANLLDGCRYAVFLRYNNTNGDATTGRWNGIGTFELPTGLYDLLESMDSENVGTMVDTYRLINENLRFTAKDTSLDIRLYLSAKTTAEYPDATAGTEGNRELHFGYNLKDLSDLTALDPGNTAKTWAAAGIHDPVFYLYRIGRIND